MTSTYPSILLFGWLALALGSAFIRSGRGRRVAAAGLSCVGLGLAAWRVGSAGSGGSLAAPDQLGDGFLVVNGGLLVLGLGLTLWGAARGGRGPARVASMLVTILGAALIARHAGVLVLAAGPGRALAAAGALGLAGAVLVMTGRAVAASGPARALARRIFTEPLRPTLPEGGLELPTAGAMLAGAGAVALASQVGVVFLGVIVAAWSAFFLFHSPSRRPVPVAPLLACLLVPAYWLLATIAGPEGLGIRALPLVPLSPAAEWLVGAALLLVAWSVSGLWPLHRQAPGALTGAVGALLLLRIALPLAPDGLEYWRPLAVPVLIVGVWHAAALARWPLAAAGAALLGVVSLAAAGATGAGWLLGSALVLELSSVAALREGQARVAQAVAWVAGAWGGLLVVEAGLRGEVVYTVFGALGIALMVAASGGQAMIASASSTPAPRA
ncbi:hypothetical protein BH24GEM1_BH24GEM1_02010 [soil metagenome]